MTGSEEPLTAEEYEAQSPKLREKLIELYLPSDYNVQDQKVNDNNVLATYRGYCKFLLLDLANNPEFAGLGKNAMKKKASILAEKMLVRGKVCRTPHLDCRPKRLIFLSTLGLCCCNPR